MKQWLLKWVTRFDALSLRERGMIGLTVFVLIVVAWQSLLLSPLTAHSRQLTGQLAAQQQLLEALDKQLQALVARQGQDPNKALRARQAHLSAQIAALDRQLHEKMQGLIAPAQMARVLEQVLTRETDLQLVRVRSLPAQPLLAGPSAGAAQGSARPVQRDSGKEGADHAGVYRHGLVIEFRGSYLSTLAYLRALQALPWAFYWDSVQLDVEHYPQARVVITVHTLSLEKGWIGV